MAAPKTFPCPACGEDVPARAKACPHCGADERSGWREDNTDGLDLPDEDFDYDKFVEEEFGKRGEASKPKGIAIVWKVTAILLLVLFVALFVFNSVFR